MPKPIRGPDFDARVLELWQKHNNARYVAQLLGVSVSTVYRSLRSSGIHQHTRPYSGELRTSNCNTRYCPALVMLLYEQCGMLVPQISETIGISVAGAWSVVCARRNSKAGYKFVHRSCEVCGRRFYTSQEYRTVCYGCLPRAKHINHRKRARAFGVQFDPTITLDGLIERDKNTCAICGKKCDINDKRWKHVGPLYPSIDHIVPMSMGGNHTWDNVQLTHLLCNVRKGNKVVNANAEEQSTSD